MYQVLVTLSCGHYNTLNIDTPAFRPQKGTEAKCKLCGQQVKVIYSGNPFPVTPKKKRLP